MTIDELMCGLNNLKMRYVLHPYDPDVKLISMREDILIYYDGVAIFADRIDHFDKPSKCPVKLMYPENEDEWEYLELKLKWLATKEGYDFARNNAWVPIDEYRRRMN